jgi:hypothetical protein
MRETNLQFNRWHTASLVVHGSTPWRISPPGTDVFAVLDNTWYGWVSAGKGKHFSTSSAIVLCVIVEK